MRFRNNLRSTLLRGAVLAAAILACTGGCTPTRPAEPSAPIFYPPPPDPPRLQFLTSFSDPRPWSPPKRSSFAEFIVGTGPAKKKAHIRSPYGIAATYGKIYICDIGVSRVHVVDIGAKTYSTLGEDDTLKRPVNITIGPDGTKYVCDTSLAKVVLFDANDRFAGQLGDPAKCVPSDLAIHGDELFVIDIAGAEVEAWSKKGKFLRHIARKGTKPGELRLPTNLAVDPRGRIFVTDTMASIVNIYSRRGQYLGSVGGPGDRTGFFWRPKGIAVDPKGILFVADAHWEFVQVFAPDGRVLMDFGGASAKPEGMGMPAGIAIDRTSLPAFRHLVHKDFEPEYLLFVVNQFGKHKIGVYAFGKSRTGDYGPAKRSPTTRPVSSR